MKKSWPIIIGVVVVGGLLWFLLHHREATDEFQTAPVTRGLMRTTVSATGTINPVRTVQVGSQVSGTIQSLAADYNSVVHAGDVIAHIDPAKFTADVERTEGDRLRAEATLVDAQRTLRRMQALRQQGLIAQGDVDTAETAAKVAEAQLKQAVAQRDLAAVNLDYTTIKSPVDGIVIARNVDVGQTVAASLQAPTLFLIAKDLTRMQIDTNVDEADIGDVRDGEQVSFTVDAYPAEEFHGAVIQVRHAPIIEQNVVKYDVVVDIDNKALKFKPGMTANVSIITHEQPDVLLVPNAALRFKPPEQPGHSDGVPTPPSPASRTQSAQAKAWVLQHHRPVAVTITKGLANDQMTEVREGLTEGQEVIISANSKHSQRKQQNPFTPRMRF